MTNKMILRAAAALVIAAFVYQPYTWNGRPSGYSFIWDPMGLPDSGMIIAEIIGITAVAFLLTLANRKK